MSKVLVHKIAHPAILVLLFLGVSASGARSIALPASEGLQVAVDRQTGLVTVKADNVPVSSILERLAEAGIEVLAPDVPDRNVSVSLVKHPLPTVLERLFPPGTHYWIRGGREDIVVPGSTGDKPGRQAIRPSNLPRKGDPGQLSPLNPSARSKPPADATPPTVDPKGQGSKLAAGTRDLPPRTGPKIAKPERVDGRYIRLHLTMMADRTVVLRDVLVLEGDLVPDVGLLGEYVYALESGGSTVVTGSFADPLVQHAHLQDPQQPHEILTAKSGDFNVSLPGSALDTRMLEAGRLVFYRLVRPPSEPNLTAETLAKLREAVTQVHAIEGSELVRRLPASR